MQLKTSLKHLWREKQRMKAIGDEHHFNKVIRCLQLMVEMCTYQEAVVAMHECEIVRASDVVHTADVECVSPQHGTTQFRFHFVSHSACVHIQTEHCNAACGLDSVPYMLVCAARRSGRSLSTIRVRAFDSILLSHERHMW
jgi:hypothetical protein